MTFKLRYSLLSLLALTAVVAVGVKLWLGPHHVNQQTTLDVEEEFTYYRDWKGNKILHGPRVRRFSDSITPVRIEIVYFRDGMHTENYIDLFGDLENVPLVNRPKRNKQSIELSSDEKAEYLAAVERERKKILDAGFRLQETSFEKQYSNRKLNNR